LVGWAIALACSLDFSPVFAISLTPLQVLR
jgi:hypothetical protein